MNNFKILSLLALAGALGTLVRYGVQEWCRNSAFPMGTLIVNLTGCLLFGIIWGLAVERGLIGATTQLVILTGFMGALTTFSTYAFDCGQLVRTQQWGPLMVNVALNNVLGIGLFLAGRWLSGART